ncbi:hypothetical protein Tco_0795873 [Tanacetum coccineum]
MADENVPAQAPTRSNDQILPFVAWVPIGKSNYVLDLQKKQKNPIFQISVDIIQNTNFFRAFTASASVPAIYIQQFWNTLTYEAKIRTYNFELDEARFVLDVNLLREALEIAPIDQAHYPTKKGRKDKAHVIPYYRFTKLIICHLGRTSNSHQRSTSPFHLVEEDLRLGNLKFVPKGEEDKVIRMPIPNELISNNIRNAPYYNAYLEMVTKHDQKVAAEKEEKKKSASTKQPKPKPTIKKSSKPEPAPKPKVTKEKPSKASTAKPPKAKPAKEKSTKATPLQKAGKGKVKKVRNVKSSFQLVNEPDEEPAHSEPELEPEHQGATRPLLVEEGKGKAIVTKEQAAQSLLALHTPKRRSTTDQFILQRRTPTTEEASTGPSAQPLDDTSANIVRDSSFPADAETGARLDKTSRGGDTEAGSDPDETHESQPPPEQAHMDEDKAGPDPGISHVALAGPDPEPTHDKFMDDLYPKVQESLKFLADEHVILEDPLSSTGTLSSMKNLEDAYAIGDQFINDKSTEDELGKLIVEAEVVSMVTVPIYQASSSVPPLSTPVIDLSPPKPASSTT